MLKLLATAGGFGGRDIYVDPPQLSPLDPEAAPKLALLLAIGILVVGIWRRHKYWSG